MSINLIFNTVAPSNYSAYFQAQLQAIPQKIVQPAKEKSKVVIRYKRNWTKEQ